MGRLVLTAQIHEVAPDGGIQVRRVAVAHLRGSDSAFAQLRHAIDRMRLLGAASEQKAN